MASAILRCGAFFARKGEKLKTANRMPKEKKPSGPRMDEGLHQAYLRTYYRIDSDPPARLQIGQDASGFAQWMRNKGYRNAILLTAWNPFSEPLPAEENERRRAEFEAEARHLGIAFVGGRGEDPTTPEWTPEESLCLFDAPLEHVDAWMRRYEQNAAVRVNEEGQVSLYWHPELRGK